MTNESDIGILTKLSLDALIGLPVLATKDIGGMRCFDFGTWHTYGDSEIATYGLHILSPWRIRSESAVFTGCGDRLTCAEGGTDDSWEPGTLVGSLLNQRLKSLFRNSEPDSSFLLNQSGELRVDDVRTDRFGGFLVRLGDSWFLEVFPTGSKDEDWVLVGPEGLKHFYFEGGRAHHD